MKIHYDPSVDALYIELHPIEPGTAQSKDLTDEIVADYTSDGKLVGIEILDASQLLGKEDLQRIFFEVSAPAIAA
jgi:uncharacterized protein YuzE